MVQEIKDRHQKTFVQTTTQSKKTLDLETEKKLQFRLATEEDIKFLNEFRFYENLEELPKDKGIIVAEKNGEILGAVTTSSKTFRYIPAKSKLRVWNLRKKYETSAWIFRLFVREDQRSKGIGKKLVKTMVTHLRKKGIKTFYAGTEPGQYQNISMRAFAASGFNVIGSCVCLRSWHKLCVGKLMKLEL